MSRTKPLICQLSPTCSGETETSIVQPAAVAVQRRKFEAPRVGARRQQRVVLGAVGRAPALGDQQLVDGRAARLLRRVAEQRLGLRRPGRDPRVAVDRDVRVMRGLEHRAVDVGAMARGLQRERVGERDRGGVGHPLQRREVARDGVEQGHDAERPAGAGEREQQVADELALDGVGREARRQRRRVDGRRLVQREPALELDRVGDVERAATRRPPPCAACSSSSGAEPVELDLGGEGGDDGVERLDPRLLDARARPRWPRARRPGPRARRCGARAPRAPAASDCAIALNECASSADLGAAGFLDAALQVARLPRAARRGRAAAAGARRAWRWRTRARRAAAGSPSRPMIASVIARSRWRRRGARARCGRDLALRSTAAPTSARIASTWRLPAPVGDLLAPRLGIAAGPGRAARVCHAGSGRWRRPARARSAAARDRRGRGLEQVAVGRRQLRRPRAGTARGTPRRG